MTTAERERLGRRWRKDVKTVRKDRIPQRVLTPPKPIAGFRESTLRDLRLDGQELDLGLRDAHQDITPELTIAGASTVTIPTLDPERTLLTTGILDLDRNGLMDKEIMLLMDGLWFVLVRVEKELPTFNLVFESDTVNVLRKFRERRKVYRDQLNRAQFLWLLVREDTRRSRRSPSRVRFFSPELLDLQRIAGDFSRTGPRSQRDTADRDAERQPGLSQARPITIKGAQATPSQISHIERSLGVAANNSATERAILAMLVAGIGESSFSAVINSLGYGGVFQGQVNTGGRYFSKDDTEEMARYFLIGGKGFQQGGAIALARANPTMTPGEIATRVEASGQPGSFYNVYLSEARNILAAYSGGKLGNISSLRTSATFEVAKRYQFTRGQGPKRENTWQAGLRLAEEVGWRWFEVGGTVVYASDDELIAQRPVMTLWEGADGVLSMSWTVDAGRPVDTCTATVHAALWGAQPGQVVELVDEGPATGRWLVESVSGSRYSPEATVELVRPTRPKPEPAAETKSVTVDGLPTDGAQGSPQTGGGFASPFGGKYAIGGAYGTDRGDHTHAGLDVSTPCGTGCIAPFDGTITMVSTSGFGTSGGMIHLRADGAIPGLGLRAGDKVGWGHISKSVSSVGQQVKAGQRIATSGGSPCHVHFVLLRAGGGGNGVDGNADPTSLVRRLGGV